MYFRLYTGQLLEYLNDTHYRRVIVYNNTENVYDFKYLYNI